MVRHFFFAANVICLLMLQAMTGRSPLLAANRQSTATDSVSDVVPTVQLVAGKPLAIVRVVNRGHAPLEAWEVHLTCTDATGKPLSVEYSTETIFDEAPAGTPDHGPLPPGDTRDQRIALSAVPVSGSATISMALFSDLSWQGSPDQSRRVLEYRERHARTLQTWIAAFAGAEGKPSADAKAILQKALAAERDRADTQTDPLALSAQEKISSLVQTEVSETEFSDRIAALKRRFELQRARALRHTAR